MKDMETASPATQVCWELAQQTRADDVLIVGVGTPLAAAAALLARAILHPSLTILFGTAVAPRNFNLAASMTDSSRVSRAAVGNYSQVEVLDLVSRGGVTLQFVSPVEVDRSGNLNASRIRRTDGSWRQFPGSLALGDTSVLVGRLVAYRVGHHRRFLPERVSFVSGASALQEKTTSSPRGLGAVLAVTEMATVSLGANPRLINYDHDLAASKNGIGFSVDERHAVQRMAAPPEVIAALARLDPLGVRDLEDKNCRAAVLSQLSRGSESKLDNGE
jgi:acyl CoA:acetate/3-ketoacid CoA transferase beta subunit